ncbi:MAG: protein TolQ [Desulfobacterales bacterium]|jgi:biopolymer transport protein TolQ|nr:protein TolQ [Desulfobacterales bacterium]
MVLQELDLFHMIQNASLMVQFVLLLLFFFSVSSWTIIIIKYRYIRKAYKESALFNEVFWKSRDFSDAYYKARELQVSPIARVFRIGFVELKRLNRTGASAGAKPAEPTGGETASLATQLVGIDNIKRALRRSTVTEITKMTQMVPFLATTGNTTPFIGLFGTVWGIMGSFHGIGMRGSASLAVVAPGISEALVATAAGLAVAIPAVIAFNYFMQKIRVIESEMQTFSADFLNIIERDYLRDKGSNR